LLYELQYEEKGQTVNEFLEEIPNHIIKRTFTVVKKIP